MIDLDRLLAALSDAKLAGLMARRGPAWALRPEGTVMLANAGGLAALGGRAQASGQVLPESAPLRRELDRLIKVLPRGGETRLERLRLPGARFAPVTTACHRLPDTALGDLVTIASLEDGGDRTASPAEIARLIAAIADAPVLVADASGKLLAWSRDAAALVGAAGTLQALVTDASAWIADAAAGPAERVVANQHISRSRRCCSAARRCCWAGSSRPRPWPRPSLRSRPWPCPHPRRRPDLNPPRNPRTNLRTSLSRSQSPCSALRRPTMRRRSPPLARRLRPAQAEPSHAPAKAATDMTVASDLSASATMPPARRLPLRFVWQTDAAGRLTHISSELAEAVGEHAADVIGTTLVDLAARLGFDADGRIGRALAKHDTWSGVNVTWPTDFGDHALVDLAGLPVFDRSRTFQGYRGFGVCRALRPTASVVAVPLPERSLSPAATAALPATAGDAGDARLAKVVPLHAPEPAKPAPSPSPPAKPALSPGERIAFREIGRVLGTDPLPASADASPAAAPVVEMSPAAPPSEPPEQPSVPDSPAAPVMPEPAVAVRAVANGERAVLERLPLGVLVYRGDRTLFANPALFDWLGLRSIEAVEQAGGLDAVFDVSDFAGADSDGKALSVRGAGGLAVPVEARLFSAPWQGESAMVLVLRRIDTPTDERIRMLELALRTAEAETREAARHPRHRHRRRRDHRPRRPHPQRQPRRRGAVRL